MHKDEPQTTAATNVSVPNSDLMDLMRRNQELMEQLMSGSMGTNELSSLSADGTRLSVTFSGHVSTSHLYLPNTVMSLIYP